MPTLVIPAGPGPGRASFSVVPSLLAGTILLAGPVSCSSRPARTELVVAYPVGPTSLDPHEALEEFSISVLGNVYETLVDTDEGLSVRPGLAQTWYLRDDRTWVFELREGVSLHDGRLLEARHVATCLERARADPVSRRRANLSMVAAIEARDRRTLVVRTDVPFATLPARLSNVFVAVDPLRSGDPPVGTGPYRIRSWTPGGDTVLEAFGPYRGGQPAIQAVRFRTVPDARERARALVVGQVDLTVDLPSLEMSRLAADDRFTVVTHRGTRVLMLGMDCRRHRNPDVSAGTNPFADHRVRQAMALAIDRDAIVGGPLGGLGRVASQVIAPGVFGYDETVAPWPFDPARSRRLLAETGHSAGFAVHLDYVPGKHRSVAEIVAAIVNDLGRVGIRVTPRPQATSQLVHRLAKQDTALFLAGIFITTGDAGLTYENLLHSPGAGFGAFNGGGYSNSTIDASIHEASRRSSLTDRWLAFRHLAELVRADVPVLPLVVATDVYASRRGLEFQPRLDRRIRAWDTRWRPAGLSNRNPCRRRPTGRDVASRAGRESGRRPHSTPHDDQPQDKGVEGQRQAKVFARSPAQSENPRDQSASPRDRGCP